VPCLQCDLQRRPWLLVRVTLVKVPWHPGVLPFMMVDHDDTMHSHHDVESFRLSSVLVSCSLNGVGMGGGGALMN
jgi:hypothetical protein